MMCMTEADEWLHVGALVAKVMRGTRRARQRMAVAHKDNVPVDDVVSDGEPVGDFGVSDDASSSSDSDKHSNHESESDAPAPAQSSGGSSSSSSSGSSDHSVADVAMPELPAVPPPRAAKNMQAATMWKGCRITPKKTGYQITCLHPAHSADKCTKTKNSTQLGDETVLRMLKTWAFWGRTCKNKPQHRDVWEQVEAAYMDGSLPPDIELEAAPANLWSRQRAKRATTK